MEAQAQQFERAPWQLPDGRVVDLITPAEYHTVEVGAVLTSIVGREVVKGIDYIDPDVRAGFLAFGFERGPTPEQEAEYLETAAALEAEVEDARLQAMGVIGRRSWWARLRAWFTHSS